MLQLSVKKIIIYWCLIVRVRSPSQDTPEMVIMSRDQLRLICFSLKTIDCKSGLIRVQTQMATSWFRERKGNQIRDIWSFKGIANDSRLKQELDSQSVSKPCSSDMTWQSLNMLEDLNFIANADEIGAIIEDDCHGDIWQVDVGQFFCHFCLALLRKFLPQHLFWICGNVKVCPSFKWSFRPHQIL